MKEKKQVMNSEMIKALDDLEKEKGIKKAYMDLPGAGRRLQGHAQVHRTQRGRG